MPEVVHNHSNRKVWMMRPFITQRLAWLPLRALFSLFGSLSVTGCENATSLKGPVIMASNHISELDPLLIVAALPFYSRHLPLYYVSREKGFYKPNWRSAVYGGNFFKMMGAYPAYTGLNDYERALRHHVTLLKQGSSIGIFPMGGIQPHGTPLMAKGGVAYLAHAHQVPIVPVRIDGAENITLSDFLLRKRKLRVTFGNPMYPNELFAKSAAIDARSNRECEAAAEKLMVRISDLDGSRDLLPA